MGSASEYRHFPGTNEEESVGFSALTLLVGRQKGIRPVKTWGTVAVGTG